MIIDSLEYLQFKVPRENTADIYKQNSPSALTNLAEHPKNTELTQGEKNLMEHVGADLGN